MNPKRLFVIIDSFGKKMHVGKFKVNRMNVFHLSDRFSFSRHKKLVSVFVKYFELMDRGSISAVRLLICETFSKKKCIYF